MLQIRGQGALHYAYVNSNHLNETRGLASFEEGLSGTTLKEIVGENAIMSVTVIPDDGQQYQGIIALDKPTIAECIEEYYHQSMQIDTKIYIFADIVKAVTGGMLLQVLPSDNHKKQAEDFNHCTTLADTLTAAEVLTLDSQDVIYRLFNQDSVNIFPNEPICFKCMCSKEHFHEMLSHLNPNEISEIISGPGSAEEARILYTETDASREHREKLALASKMQLLYAPHPKDKPDKKQRRELLSLKHGLKENNHEM